MKRTIYTMPEEPEGGWPEPETFIEKVKGVLAIIFLAAVVVFLAYQLLTAERYYGPSVYCDPRVETCPR